MPMPNPVVTTGSVRRPRTRRNVELALLIFAMIVVLLFSAAVEAGMMEEVTPDFWVPVGVSFLIFLGMHFVIRWLAPYADPVLLPAVALINGMGIAFLRRLDLGAAPAAQRADLSAFSGDSVRQLFWTAAAVVGATLLLFIMRDHKSLSRYAYTLGLVGIVLVLIPAVLPARFSAINGAKLWIKVGPENDPYFSIQPGEFAKICLLSFFAYYLVRKREVLSLASKRILGIDFPRARDLGPVLVVWLVSLMVLIFEKDLGTSLLYFGMFVVTLYIATERASWLIIGLLLFFGGAISAYFLGAAIGGPFANFYDRANIWLDPFADANGTGYQLVQSLLGLGTGGMFGVGPGKGLPYLADFDQYVLPAVHNDFIFAGLGEEIGLFGLTAMLAVYLFIAVRGLRAAITVRDSFGKLLAGGLSFTLGLQVFVIIGGISQLIPLTGQTTPFLSAGGSSLMANWLLVAVLLRVSDAGRRPVTLATGGGGVVAPPQKLADIPTEVVR
ncbi:FtsW/RodA/SpoVE family cell cycle protein [Luedemannella helvata]|uniref:FtsW/RodA/SpoVE family cell cycle protein n=1 Tax=Luedemannella helvata TaxID=349315 RepID=UPI0031D8E8A2